MLVLKNTCQVKIGSFGKKNIKAKIGSFGKKEKKEKKNSHYFRLFFFLKKIL
jgi:hypothetical protein